MSATGNKSEPPELSLWETLASTLGPQPQDQSDNWAQSLNYTATEFWGLSSASSQKKPSPPSWMRPRVSSPSRSRNRYREPCHDYWRGSWSSGTNKVSTSLLTPNSRREGSQPEWGKRPEVRPVGNSRAHARSESYWSSRSPVKSPSRSRCSSPLFQAAREVKKRNIKKGSDCWGMCSSCVERSMPRSLSPWSQAARSSRDNSDCKGSNRWGKDLDQTIPVTWDPSKSSDLLPNHGSRWEGGLTASRSRNRSTSTEKKSKRDGWGYSHSPDYKRRKIGQHLDRSRCREHSVSPEYVLRKTRCGRGRSPANNRKTNYKMERQLHFSSPKTNCSHKNEKTASHWRVESTTTRCGPSIARFKYPTLESDASRFSNCGGTKSGLVPIGNGPPQISKYKLPAIADEVNSVAAPPSRLTLERLPPAPTTDGTVGSTLSPIREGICSNTSAAKTLAPSADLRVMTTCSRGNDTEPELSIIPVCHTSVVAVAGMPQTDQIAALKVGASRSKGSDTKSESAADCEVEPTAKVPKLGESQPIQSAIFPSAAGKRKGEADWTRFCSALVKFAKPTVKQFWLSGVLTDANYQEILDRLWKEIYVSLGAAAPQTDERIQKFIKDKRDSLGLHLQVCLNQYLSGAQ